MPASRYWAMSFAEVRLDVLKHRASGRQVASPSSCTVCGNLRHGGLRSRLMCAQSVRSCILVNIYVYKIILFALDRCSLECMRDHAMEWLHAAGRCRCGISWSRTSSPAPCGRRALGRARAWPPASASRDADPRGAYAAGVGGTDRPASRGGAPSSPRSACGSDRAFRGHGALEGACAALAARRITEGERRAAARGA